ncbi:hypothetical protein A33K_12787 [Burkholderia humptydooensis MSMB43]|uniref:Uncharacterized protein n=1 Tax=Burkholderia humptydooensis MSMB43 TaxID=441157 RepID=A0ABN0GAE3_9BURK|nr:hypothetical protein A33K_12787 [Burkholderia humptydooensis MSMB43]
MTRRARVSRSWGPRAATDGKRGARKIAPLFASRRRKPRGRARRVRRREPRRAGRCPLRASGLRSRSPIAPRSRPQDPLTPAVRPRNRFEEIPRFSRFPRPIAR